MGKRAGRQCRPALFDLFSLAYLEILWQYETG
jgi:hypothetical protein